MAQITLTDHELNNAIASTTRDKGQAGRIRSAVQTASGSQEEPYTFDSSALPSEGIFQRFVENAEK